MDKETSSRVSSIAGRLNHIKPATIIEAYHNGREGLEKLCDEIQAVAGSALVQDQTPGQSDKPARKFPPEVTATREGSRITVNVDYGPSTYQTWFSVGDEKGRDAAIASLTEKICGFSTSTILIAIHNTENDHAE